MRFEALRETLLIAGIAPRHVRRYLRELDDHLADLTEAQRAAGHGNEDAAVRARALWRRCGIGGGRCWHSPVSGHLPARAPWLVFGLFPPLVIFGRFFAAGLPLVLIARLHGMVGTIALLSRLVPISCQSHGACRRSGAGSGATVLLVWTARRQRLNWNTRCWGSPSSRCLACAWSRISPHPGSAVARSA